MKEYENTDNIDNLPEEDGVVSASGSGIREKTETEIDLNDGSEYEDTDGSGTEDVDVYDRERWQKKLAAMKREKIRRQKMFRLARIGITLGVLLIAGTVFFSVRHAMGKSSGDDADIDQDVAEEPVMLTELREDPETEEPVKASSSVTKHYSYTEADNCELLGGDNMTSANAILVNLNTNEIVGQRDYRARIVPASMTKVLTVLVAAENIEDYNDPVTITIEATDYAYSNDCSSVGFAENEVVTVEDLFYGTILSSGGDAAYQLALYTAGSMDAFIDMMNDKLDELGLAGSAHFTNCVGLYDENHYCTVYDLAVIMNAAMDNEFCRKVLSAHQYTTSCTEQHPEGITISNWFLRRIEDKDTGGEVIGAKTGFVVQSKNCAVSYAESNTGVPYICVTASAHSAWRCIYDHVDIYKNHTN
ncbi:MAG: D-alanyl-D-alanine carboxypeptidase [Lachnospiraceae bacterium]|nr:D-alanyl-D-alanine carboxypeptidase [Lachnospiraceae bacterium]